MPTRRDMLKGTFASVAAAAGLKPEQMRAVELDKPPIAFVIEVTGRLSLDAMRRLQDSWQRVFTGTEYANTPALILEEGMRLHVVTNDDAVSVGELKSRLECRCE